MSGREFFPAGSVRWDLLREAGVRPGPRGMGPETTFDVVVDNRVARHGAWCYGDPAPDLLNIKNLITFGLDSVVPVRHAAPLRPPERWRAALCRVLRGAPATSGR
jgi:uncharacterized protein (DUF427 family)